MKPILQPSDVKIVQCVVRDRCRLCDGMHVDRVVSLVPTPIADHYVTADARGAEQASYPLDLYQCRHCGHVQLLDVVDPDLLFRDYTYRTSASPGLVEHFRQFVAELMPQLRPRPGSLAIDIGSNDGTFLRLLQPHGMRVLGVDPACAIAEQATRSGIETLPTFFTAEIAREIAEEKGRAALITAHNVVAHADDLADIARGVRDLLAPDGVFIFEVSYLVDILQDLLFDTIYHEHLSYHSVAPLVRFFVGNGLEVIDVERTTSKGGSVRITVQLLGGPRTPQPSVAVALHQEEELGLDQQVTYRRFASRIDRVRNELAATLAACADRGLQAVGFGASATVTTLLYQFDLGDTLQYLVDDHPGKHGLFSPGLHLPILPPQTLYDAGPTCVVVLAWRYAAAVMKNHRRLLDRGSRFLVPLPAVTLT